MATIASSASIALLSAAAEPIEYEGAIMLSAAAEPIDYEYEGAIMFSAAAEPIAHEGSGKYQWDDSRPLDPLPTLPSLRSSSGFALPTLPSLRSSSGFALRPADSALAQAITKYGWSDGKKQVSVYIELVPSSSTSSLSQAIILKIRVSNVELQTLIF